MDQFFSKYICLRQKFNKDELKKAKSYSPTVFLANSLGTFSHWYGKNKENVMIVGLKKNAEALLKIIKEAVVQAPRYLRLVTFLVHTGVNKPVLFRQFSVTLHL